MFSSAKSLNKVESLQKRALCFQYDSYDSAYGSILKLAGKCAMNVSRLRRLCIKILKTLSNINPAFMNEFLSSGRLIGQFEINTNLNLEVPIPNQVTFGAKSVGYLGPKICNSLPVHIESNESLTTFKRIIKN